MVHVFDEVSANWCFPLEIELSPLLSSIVSCFSSASSIVQGVSWRGVVWVLTPRTQPMRFMCRKDEDRPYVTAAGSKAWPRSCIAWTSLRWKPSSHDNKTIFSTTSRVSVIYVYISFNSVAGVESCWTYCRMYFFFVHYFAPPDVAVPLITWYIRQIWTCFNVFKNRHELVGCPRNDLRGRLNLGM